MKKWLAMTCVGSFLCIHEGLPAQTAARIVTSGATRLDKYMAPLLDLQVFSGTILVAQRGRYIVERSYGLADVENRIPIRGSTVFRIASISKSFTRALIGKLADQKLLSIDDTLSRWLPAIPSANRITVRMLLDHRSGIPNVNSLPYDEEAFQPNSLSQLVDSIARGRLDFEPGTRHRYSNGGYAVLARVVELATHERFDRVLDREILHPLHLEQTIHETDGMIVEHLAQGYMPSPEMPNRLVRAPFQEMNTKTGGGSLVSSSRDLVRWARAIGRSNILKHRTWAELFPDKDSGFAFQGRAPGFNVVMRHDRKRDITTVVLTNNYAAGMAADVASGAEAIGRGEAPRALPVVSPVRALARDMRTLAGTYSFPDGALPVPPGTSVEIRRVENNLVAYLGSVPVDVLIPQGPRTWLARALWSMVEATGSGLAADSIKVRALYRDFAFTARRKVK